MEIYEGVKFTTEFLSNNSPKISPNMEELIHWSKKFHEKNLCPDTPQGSGGNMSYRLNPSKDDFVITGTQTKMKDKLRPEDFVLVKNVDLEKKTVSVSGKIEPSSESIMHYLTYNRCPDINAIFHGHSDIILKKAKELSLPHTEIELPYGSLELAQAATKLALKHKFFILKNHGFIAIGKTQDRAAYEALKFV
ncbi:MAG: class II aldolase/adducin family protein [Bacteroidales bacterium]|jgi:ribulose-5-phosphate 4-epimerase/fuculose-1-phosphate aldolase|nr:class II aldolase/adducin family protein [Bacteroidales bacterium]